MEGNNMASLVQSCPEMHPLIKVVFVLVGVEHFHVLEGVVGRHGEVDVTRGKQVKHTGLEIQILHREALFTLGHG